MKQQDLESVWALEKACFRQPYSLAILTQELKIKAARLWVVPWENKVIGYLDFWLVADEMELVSIAVHPHYQGQGIAKILMRKMLKYAKLNGAHSIVLDVRDSNHRAQALYQKFGFKEVGRRKKYYSDNNEDAIIMKWQK